MRNLSFILFSFCFSVAIHAQTTTAKTSSNTAIDPRITEAYGSEIGRLQSDPERLSDVTAILSRYEFVQEKRTPNEKYPKLSEMPLFNKYNPEVKRDEVVDRDNFNILKYNLEFYSKFAKVYRIDNTDYILVIQPQKRK